ncbi:lipase 3-like [Teleopsis dalmanni]|uniref:lipase 3-like n=1 Tax=Teleopsis dalmanni TaxID=139649 RepID=UPI0018CEC9EF|nr:lipase 3-like [Teleopsis dalmanni]
MFRELVISLAVLAVVSAGRFDYKPYINTPPLKDITTSADRIQKHGYPAESHFVETEDGYVLNMFRVPYSPKLNNENEQKPVVFIMHGLFSCSDCFLLNGPDDSIVYNFADQNYDVWLGNARGNIYSCENTKVSKNSPKFWEFSWHEIGNIDVPTMIDYILDLTGESKVHYVGHSQGTTVFFVMTSTRPEYNDKIKTAHMLAPPIFMGNVTDGLVVGLAPYVAIPGSVGAALLESQQFVPYNPVVQRILDTGCGDKPRYPKYCLTLFLMWAGDDQGNLNATLLPQLAETHPAGIATNQGIHYMQSYLTNDFRYYDWGEKKNLQRYNQKTPPKYDLTNIVANMYLYYGLADGSANAEDVSRLPEYLPNIKFFHEIPDPTWGHLDFIFANQVKEVINDKVINFCNDYEKGDVY